MSKFVCSATVNLTRNDLGSVAQIVIDRIEDDFGVDAMVVAGLSDTELLDALINSKQFQELVCEKVSEDGRVVCEDPYGYFDAFDFIDFMEPLQRIYDLVEDALDLLNEADKEEVVCVPVPAGYKLVKI